MKVGSILAVSVALAAILAASTAGWLQQHPTEASPTLLVGLDMDPTGNFCSGSTASGETCTLGAVDSCISVPNTPGYRFDVDLFVTGLDNGFLQFNELLYFPDTQLQVVAADQSTASVALCAQSNTSNCSDFHELPLPDTASPFSIACSEAGTTENATWTLGTLARITLEVKAGAISGVYSLTLAGPPLAAYLDQYMSAYIIDAITGGLVAIGQPCPAVTATPTPTPTPTPIASPTPTPTATPPAGVVPLVTGWNDSCYSGLPQATSDAFAPVVANVQAVYRMRSDQTFDRWFPARADLSTMATLNPFDQLFILATGDGIWTIQTVAQPPSSALLHNGWNSVCYLGGGKDTAAAAAGISGDFSIMYNLTSNQVWRRYVPGRPELSNLAQLETFTSVLMLMTDPEGGTWAFSP